MYELRFGIRPPDNNSIVPILFRRPVKEREFERPLSETLHVDRGDKLADYPENQ
jgi:hypothetical protein